LKIEDDNDNNIKVKGFYIYGFVILVGAKVVLIFEFGKQEYCGTLCLLVRIDGRSKGGKCEVVGEFGPRNQEKTRVRLDTSLILPMIHKFIQ